jgi:hypothetical protein
MVSAKRWGFLPTTHKLTHQIKGKKCTKKKKIHHAVKERKEVEEKEHMAQRKNCAEPDPRLALIWPATETHS